MSEKYTDKQLSFCKSYITNHDAKKSALEAGYSKNFAEKKSYQLLKEEKIIKKIQELESTFYTDTFAQLAYESMGILKEILVDELAEEKVKLAAIKEIFKYSGLEKKLNLNNNSESTQFNINFNEVASRDT